MVTLKPDIDSLYDTNDNTNYTVWHGYSKVKSEDVVKFEAAIMQNDFPLMKKLCLKEGLTNISMEFVTGNSRSEYKRKQNRCTRYNARESLKKRLYFIAVSSVKSNDHKIYFVVKNNEQTGILELQTNVARKSRLEFCSIL